MEIGTYHGYGGNITSLVSELTEEGDSSEEQIELG